MPVPGSAVHDLPGVGGPPQRAALGQEVAVLGVEEVDLDQPGRLAVHGRLVHRRPRLAAVGRAQQVARARGEERAAGAVDARRAWPCATSLPLTAENVSPLSVERRSPVGPARMTVDVVGAASCERARGRAGVEGLPRGAAVVGAEQAARRVQRVADERRREGDVDDVLRGRDVAARPRLAAVDRLGQRAVVARRERRARLAAGAHARVGPAQAPADRGEVQPRVVGDRRGAGGAARGDARRRGEAGGEDRVLARA